MAVNRVVVGDEVKFDLSADSVTPQTLLAGATAHSAAGDPIEGAVVVAPIDAAPTEGSGNAVSSGGVWSALQDVGGGGTIDTEVVEDSPNAVSGGAVYDALKGLKVGFCSRVITESQTLDLSTLGIRVGDEITVVCVGGGGAGGGSSGGDAGEAGSDGSRGSGGAAGAGYGAGGGGYGGYKSSSNTYGGAGGGGSGYMTKVSITVSELSVAVTVGAAGEASILTAGSGGTTSFGAYLSANGGSGGGKGLSSGSPGSGGAGGNPGSAGETAGGKGGDGYDVGFFDAKVATGETISGAGCVMLFWLGITV